jgi:hypothetical protein
MRAAVLIVKEREPQFVSFHPAGTETEGSFPGSGMIARGRSK